MLMCGEMNTEAQRLALERGERIRTARKAAGFTLDELAKDINMSRATLWKWETGQVESYGAVAMLWLARRLHTTQEWILFGQANPWETAARRAALPSKPAKRLARSKHEKS